MAHCLSLCHEYGETRRSVLQSWNLNQLEISVTNASRIQALINSALGANERNYCLSFALQSPFVFDAVQVLRPDFQFVNCIILVMFNIYIYRDNTYRTDVHIVKSVYNNSSLSLSNIFRGPEAGGCRVDMKQRSKCQYHINQRMRYTYCMHAISVLYMLSCKTLT